MRAVVGIDPSLSGFAVAVAGPPGWAIGVERLETPAARTCHGRVLRLDRLVRFALERVEVAAAAPATLPPLVLVEGYSLMSKGAGHHDTTELGGVLRREIWFRAGVRAVEVPPGTLKKFATGKGNANKTVVVSRVALRWGVEFGTDDEYDAYALARLGLVVVGRELAANVAASEAARVVLATEHAEIAEGLRNSPGEIPSALRAGRRKR